MSIARPWREDGLLSILLDQFQQATKDDPRSMIELKTWLDLQIAAAAEVRQKTARRKRLGVGGGSHLRTTRRPSVTKPQTTPWLTAKEAAEYISLSTKTLANYRSSHSPLGPRYHKQAGVIRYFVADLDAWIEGRK